MPEPPIAADSLTRPCRHCGEPIDITAPVGRPREFCDGACRYSHTLKIGRDRRLAARRARLAVVPLPDTSDTSTA